jgi:hypothetical protein
MPLYECSKCHAVENTALTNFWMDLGKDRPPLCSACDPDIGKWHGKFDKRTLAEYRQLFPDRKIEYPIDEATQKKKVHP